MNLPEALTHLFKGKRIANEHWNNCNYSYLFAMPGYLKGIKANKTLATAANIPEGTDVVIHPYLMICTKSGSYTPYTFTDMDVFSESWYIKTGW